MADAVDLKGVVKHLVDGTFDEYLCRICLLPLGTVCENIFTRLCKEDEEFCIADILDKLCGLKFSYADNCSVCPDCFLMASTAYKFYITSKRSEEILNFYVEELSKNVFSIEMPEDISNDTLCITLPEFEPSINNFDYDIECCLTEDHFIDHDKIDTEQLKRHSKNIKEDPKIKIEIETIESKKVKSETGDDELVIVIGENGQRSFFKVTEEGLELVSKGNMTSSKDYLENKPTKKLRRKRYPMLFTKCNYCPVKYRLLTKLKAHMKAEHDVDLLICKICKAITEDPVEHENHLASHTGVHRCDYCNTIFKKRKTIIAHIKWHEEMNIHNIDSAHVCELCGFILLNEEQLKEHYDKKHDKKFTCFYCGKMYKGEMSCETHIRKHEMHLMKESEHKKAEPTAKEPRRKQPADEGKRRTVCATCGKTFVDERSLMWHTMLHNNKRPHTCDTCGRGFISINRRNQHMLCAHTLPTKRCPLCPALFHLRSMVNSHIKKVHLKPHKRRNRSSKHQNMNVHWRTEPVPIQELGVDIQNEIIELTSRQKQVKLETGDMGTTDTLKPATRELHVELQNDIVELKTRQQHQLSLERGDAYWDGGHSGGNRRYSDQATGSGQQVTKVYMPHWDTEIWVSDK